MTALLLLFCFGFLLFLFLLWLLWLKLPKLCWIIVVRMGILVLFLILEEMVSPFHHWEWCWLWVCHIWPLLWWGKFPMCLLSGDFFFNDTATTEIYTLSLHDALPISICIPFISFSSLIAVARTSRTMLNNSGESGPPCLVPDLRGNSAPLFITLYRVALTLLLSNIVFCTNPPYS